MRQTATCHFSSNENDIRFCKTAIFLSTVSTSEAGLNMLGNDIAIIGCNVWIFSTVRNRKKQTYLSKNECAITLGSVFFKIKMLIVLYILLYKKWNVKTYKDRSTYRFTF